MRTLAFKRSIRRAARVAALVVMASGVALGAASSAQAQSGVPYHDPNAVASLGLCSANGQPLTHGSTDAIPFVAHAVSTQPAPAPYDKPGRTASLYAYQPIQYIPAGEWSGELLTAAGRYTNPAHPMTAATSRDYSLANFVSDFPPHWQGFVQLRIYLGAPDAPAVQRTYAAADLRVTGHTWTLVDGAQVPCNAGRSVSVETILLPSVTPKTKGHKATVATPPPTVAAAGPATALRNASGTTSSHSDHTPLLVGLAAAAAVLVGVGGFLARRRFTSATPDLAKPGSSETGI